MDTAQNILTLPNVKLTTKSRKSKAKAATISAHRSRKEKIAAGIRTFLTAVNVGVIAVSLKDIAECAMHYGHVATWQGYALALGVDASYIGMEFAGLFAPTPGMRHLAAARELLDRGFGRAIQSIDLVLMGRKITELSRDELLQLDAMFASAVPDATKQPPAEEALH